MSKSRHTEAQMIASLKQAKAGRTTEDVARQGVSKHTIYAWKAKYGGTEASEASALPEFLGRMPDFGRGGGVRGQL